MHQGHLISLAAATPLAGPVTVQYDSRFTSALKAFVRSAKHTLQNRQSTSNALMLSSKLLCRLGFKLAPAAFSIFPMLINWVRYRCRSASCNASSVSVKKGTPTCTSDSTYTRLLLLEEGGLSGRRHSFEDVRHSAASLQRLTRSP